MILKSRYDKVMEHIEVTPAMHDRIMRTLNNVDLTQKQSKVIPFKSYSKSMSIAACFTVLLISSFLIYNHINISKQPQPVQVVSGIVECSSIDKLSKAVGFKVHQVQTLPFKVEQTQFFSFWGKLAQIVYTGEKNVLTFRMSASTEDNSGDYSEYSNMQIISISHIAVTLKGNGDLYKLAIWNSKGYSYSINVSDDISKEEIITIVKSIQ